MRTGLLAGACLIALSCSLPADAQQAQTSRPIIGGHGNNVEAFIAQHDERGEGRVSWKAFEAFRRQRFDATDENGDGVVDVEEYVQEFEDRSRQALEQSRSRQLEQAERRFEALDTDRDGRVSRAEFDASGARQFAAFQKLPPKPAGDDGDAAARFDRRDRLALPSGHDREGFLALFDANGDGQVDAVEFGQVRDAQFARTDTDGDGVLVRDEYLAEFEDRLDRHVAARVEGSDRQTRVRFAALDTDKDGKMTFEEYQVSGRRLFDSADRDKSGVVDAADAKLPPPARPRRPANAAAGDAQG